MLPASMRSFRLLLAVGCLALLAAAPASGAVRYAAPGAMGGSPCNPAPCGLVTAVTGANNGDQVVLAAGAYKLATTLAITKPIDVGGALGASTVVEFSGNNGIEVSHPGALLHDLRPVLSEPALANTVTLNAGTVERVHADGAKGAAGCDMKQGLLRDSVCRGGLNVSPNGAGSYQATITNVTANPLSIGAQGGANLAASVTNTLMLPDSEGGGPKAGLLINVGMGASAAALITNSSYNEVDPTLSAGTEFQYTPAGTNGNQTVAPALVDAAAGDFRQLASSPTIDAGTTAVDPLGAFDLLGAARSQPRCIGGAPVPDIGAYELTPTEACPGPPPVPSPVPSNFGVRKLTFDRAKGTATLTVRLQAAGTLALSGKGVVGRSANRGGAGTVKVKIQAKGGKAKKLRKRGKVKLRARLMFVPASTGELPTTKTRALTLKLQQKP